MHTQAPFTPDVCYYGETYDHVMGRCFDKIVWRGAEMDTQSFTLDTFQPDTYPRP